MHINALTNPYLSEIHIDRYPKAVLAAVLVSLLTCGGDHIGDVDVDAMIVDEWRALHNAGIVPQKPR